MKYELPRCQPAEHGSRSQHVEHLETRRGHAHLIDVEQGSSAAVADRISTRALGHGFAVLVVFVALRVAGATVAGVSV